MPRAAGASPRIGSTQSFERLLTLLREGPLASIIFTSAPWLGVRATGQTEVAAQLLRSAARCPGHAIILTELRLISYLQCVDRRASCGGQRCLESRLRITNF
jgi:hypothetical protein